MDFPKIYISFGETKSGRHSVKETLIKNEHGFAAFLHNLRVGHKYEVRDLTDQELIDYGFLKEPLPADTPITQPKATPKSHNNIKIIAAFISMISKHPLWSAIIAGLILLILSHFIFGTP